jgi:hypothetical protein
MAESNSNLSAVCNYEHRDGKGRLVSVGTTKTDWLGYYHVTQKNLRTGEVVKAIYRPDRSLKVSKKRISLRIRFLRMVGLRKK